MFQHTIFCVLKLDELTFIWIKNVGKKLYRFVTMHAFDGQTDGRTGGQTDRQVDADSNSVI